MAKPSALSSLIEEGQLPIKQRKLLGEETAETLRELILLGKLPAGASIPERDLADALGISRTPMREAMRVLETEGLIEYSATRLTFKRDLIIAPKRIYDFCQSNKLNENELKSDAESKEASDS